MIGSDRVKNAGKEERGQRPLERVVRNVKFRRVGRRTAKSMRGGPIGGTKRRKKLVVLL